MPEERPARRILIVDDDDALREVLTTALSAEGRESVETDLYDVSANNYEGGSPLYDTLIAASAYMNGEAADGALSVIVVLTNSSQDEVSDGTAEATAAGLEGPTVVYTVGFGQTDPTNLSILAEATGGSFVTGPGEGGLLDAIS